MRAGMTLQPSESIVVFTYDAAVGEGTDAEIKPAVGADDRSVDLMIAEAGQLDQQRCDDAIGSNPEQSPAAKAPPSAM